MLDEYTDKLYDQFVPEGGKQQRKLLKEEREKVKKEEENAAQVKKALFHFSPLVNFVMVNFNLNNWQCLT